MFVLYKVLSICHRYDGRLSEYMITELFKLNILITVLTSKNISYWTYNLWGKF